MPECARRAVTDYAVWADCAAHTNCQGGRLTNALTDRMMTFAKGWAGGQKKVDRYGGESRKRCECECECEVEGVGANVPMCECADVDFVGRFGLAPLNGETVAPGSSLA